MSNLLEQGAEPQTQSTNKEKFPWQYNQCPFCGATKRRYSKACRACCIPRKKKPRRRSPPRIAIEQPINPYVKLVPLTKGQITEIDAEDFDRVTEFNWQANKSSTKCGFSVASAGTRDALGRQQRISLAAFILRLPKGTRIDHKDGNGLNNKKENLRPATSQENSRNRSRMSTNTTGYIGVTSVKYRAQLMADGMKIPLGAYTDPIHAAKVRDMAAVKYFGEFARLNFPELLPKYKETISCAGTSASPKTWLARLLTV